MRKKIEILDKPSLKVHIDYDHLTVGELGNILIRLQAALRSIAGLSPGEYDGRYSVEQPRFITSTVHTGKSIDVGILLAVIAIVLGIPGAINNWKSFAANVFRRIKTAILAMTQGEIQHPEEDTGIEGLRVRVTKGKIDLEVERPFLDELTPKQRRAIANFLWSLTGPAQKVIISDDESEISIEWTEKNEEAKGE